VISNETNLNAVQGAGLQAAQTLVNQGVQAVVTGHVGPKAFAGLRSANVTIYTGAEGTVRQALEAFQAGRLRALSQADVQGHW